MKEESNSLDQHGELIKPFECMSWRDMKEFCAKLNEEQLDAKVFVWREEETVTQLSAETLSENQYIYKDEPSDGCFPESERDWQIEHADCHADDFEQVYKKGHPLLWENF